MPHAPSGLLDPGPDALLQAARSLEMKRLALLLSWLQEPRASLSRVVLQALTVLWCWLWMDGPQSVLANEAAKVLPASIALLVASVAWAAWVNLHKDRGVAWRDAVGLFLSLVMVTVQVDAAFILLMTLSATLPFLVIAATAAYGRRAIAPAIAATALGLLWAAPEGYWISRPAYLAYALALTILLPAVVASMVAAMRDIALRAVASREAQGRFIGTMSHELRTPLNAIINGIQLLDMDAATSAQRSSFAMVARQARALRHRIDDVLDVASIEGGTLRLRPQPCSLASALDAMQESCAPAAAEKGVLLTVQDCDPAVWMLIDAGRVEQVISNLVCNGIKFSPVGGETRVSIDASRIGEQWQVQVTVSDSGCGIDESDQEAIFSPFVQVSEGDARCEQGVGLGLYIVRLISDAMGATIEVGRSTWGGASFQWCFTAPAVIGDAASPSLEAVFNAHAASVRSLHCLLFEDVETNRQVVERLMECAGHRLSCRHDGRDAQAAVASLAPDVVLLDLHMPGCSGWDVLEAIGSRTEGPPILVMSADTRLQVIERARSMGAAGFLCKPLDVHEVLRMLHEVAPRGSSL